MYRNPNKKDRQKLLLEKPLDFSHAFLGSFGVNFNSIKQA